MKAVDTDGNGNISYEGQWTAPGGRRLFSNLTLIAEFRTFVEATEKELLALFRSIDYNNDGKLSKPELRAALSRAGLAVPNSSLDNFFAEVDTNHDGSISFDEWRYVLGSCILDRPHRMVWLYYTGCCPPNHGPLNGLVQCS